MSRTFSIACTACEVQLWIGQTNEPLYHGMADRMAQLSRFLVAHTDCPLVYGDDERLGFDEFERLDELEWQERDASTVPSPRTVD